jgi:hypothetical protein
MRRGHPLAPQFFLSCRFREDAKAQPRPFSVVWCCPMEPERVLRFRLYSNASCFRHVEILSCFPSADDFAVGSKGKMKAYALTGTQRRIWRFLHADLDANVKQKKLVVSSAQPSVLANERRL